MPRRARIAVPGIPWHIIQRGNNRSACFYAQADYRVYLETLQQQAREFGCTIHAYVLMTNHVHLLVTPEERQSVSLMMKHLGQRYVQYVNRTYRRTGTLWEGRFKSCIAQENAYVLTCYRYIELNPVRAHMVAHPRDYPWSSFRANGDGKRNPLITPHPDYLALASDHSQRLAAYSDLFTDCLQMEQIDQVRSATNGNFVLGNKRFQEEIAKMLARRVVPGKAGRPRKQRDF